MATANIAPASAEPPPRRDWLDATFRLATSWVGLFTAYAVAVLLALTRFKELTKGLQDIGIRPGLGIALIAALPLLALVFSTIPTFIEQRRIKRYSEITGAIQTGYFTLRPRDDEEHFERADNAQQEVLRWIENTREPVLYLTGASGTGKSSLLSAWVIPNLKRKKHVVIELRGYEDDLLARIKDELVQPGVIWDKAPGKTDDLRSLLDRAAQRLGDHRLLIVVDQFEEFLILKDEDRQSAFRQFLAGKPTGGITFLLVYRPEYEGLIQDQPWPKLQLDTNRRVIGAFTENAAQEFMRKSGLAVDAGLMRKVLREAAEIEQTTGLIRPVTINLCGLVLSRFASGLPRRFRGGLIRGFLRESLSLPEVRDVAGKLIPQLITDNVTKQPRTIADLAQATLVAPSAVRACLRRLGESDRAIVRPLDQQQETWEISHDFLVPLLDSIVARRTVSWWRAFRPWLPWTAAAVMGIAAVAIPLMTRQDPRVVLTKQGWTISEDQGVLQVLRDSPIPPESIPILRGLPPPFGLGLSGSVTDVSPLRELKNLTTLDLRRTQVTDVSALRGLTNLTLLDLSAQVTDISALRELKNLTQLNLSGTQVTDVSTLRELKNLTWLNLDSTTQVTDISALRELKNLTQLDLGFTYVTDVTALLELKSLTTLNLMDTPVKDVSALRGLKSLTDLDLSGTQVTDITALRELTNLIGLDLSGTQVTDITPLRELKSMMQLFLNNTHVTDISALRGLTHLTELNLNHTQVTDISALRELTNLTELYLDSNEQVTDISALRELKNLTVLYLPRTQVADISTLRGLKNLTRLDLSGTRVTDVSALRELKSLTVLDLSNTQVTDVSALRELTNLKELHLSGTKVADVSALRELKNLRQLDLKATHVTDITPLRELKDLEISR